MNNHILSIIHYAVLSDILPVEVNIVTYVAISYVYVLMSSSLPTSRFKFYNYVTLPTSTSIYCRGVL